MDGRDPARYAHVDLKALFEDAQDPVFLYDLETMRIERVNDVVVRQYGYTREELAAMTLKELRPREDVARFERAFAQSTSKASFLPQRFPGIWRHARKDGSSFDVEVLRLRVLLGDRMMGIAIARDVTAQEQRNRDLRALGEKWQSLVESSPDYIMTLDTHDRITFLNRTSGGFRVEELLGKCVLDLMREPDRARVAELLREVRGTGATLRDEATGQMPDGSVRVFERRWMPLRAGGEAHAVLSISSDITARRRAEEAVRANEERFRAMIESTNDAIALLAADSTILYASPETPHGAGIAVDGLIGRSAFDFIHPEDLAEVRARLKTIVASPRSTVVAEFRARQRDGSWVWTEGRATNLLDNPSVGAIVASYRDITERRRLEGQLRQSQKMEAVGLLAGGIAHDFNNLLSIILASAEMAERTGRAQPQSLEEIVSAATRAAQLTRKLLAFSRKQVLHVQVLDLNEAVEDFSKLLARVVGEDVELVVRRRGGRLVVRADAAQIEQVLLNLCTNARQAMPRGGKLSIETALMAIDEAYVAHHPWARTGIFAELLVVDSGEGMDETTRTRAFEPFFTTKAEGSGLGLATVYGIVQQHHGCVDVESVPGSGTTVRVLLPVAETVATAPRTVEESPLLGGRETLLIAEDEAPLRTILARTLEELGYKVITAEDGERACLEFEQRAKQIDLVILDVVMPKLGGPESFARMKAIDPEVKVLFTTGYAPSSAHVDDLVAKEGHLVLCKPFKLQELTEMVREALTR